MDNLTPHLANEYNAKIETTVPWYNFFHTETIDLVKTINPNPTSWLDTGCGTGTFAAKVLESFHSKIKLVLADPSEAMLDIAKEKLIGSAATEFLLAGTQTINYPENSFHVITAIQSHHYLTAAIRQEATLNCYKMLKPGGIYITFENIRPITEKGITLGLQRWKQFQINHGKTETAAENHIKRFDVEYFPISIMSHINTLTAAGFNTAEILWVSNLQGGFYAIK